METMRRLFLNWVGPVMLAGWAAAGLEAACGQECSAPVRDAQRIVRPSVVSWYDLQRAHVVMQRRDYSCGAAALATLITYYWGDPVSEEYFLQEIARLLTPEELQERVANGLALTDLRRAAVEAGYEATMGTLSFDQLADSRAPVIVGIITHNLPHFVVYRGTDGEYVYLADPARGNVRVLVCEFVNQWQQNAILVVAKPDTPVPQYSPLSVTCPEIRLGELNWQHVRSVPVVRPHVPR
jgi:hypothetical protein